MPTLQLQFLNRGGKTSTFFDPLNIDNTLKHSVSVSRRTVGPDRLRQVRNDFTQTRYYKYKSCNTAQCGVNDYVGGSVVLYGVTESEVVKNWSDLKANVDAAIAAGVLKGVPLSMALDTLIVTQPEVPSEG